MERLTLIDRKPLQLVVCLLLAFFVYGMGTYLILNPQTRPEALRMTPLALLLTVSVLFFFAGSRYTRTMVGSFALIALIGFLVELIGVQTGWVFGRDQYTSHFGVRWWGTPPLIGINWLFLTYAWAAVARNSGNAPKYRMLLAAAGMLAYDLLLEQAAPLMQLWHWEGRHIPLSNYLAWFGLALFFQWILHFNRIDTRNSLALPLLLLQIAMYVCIILFIQ